MSKKTIRRDYPKLKRPRGPADANCRTIVRFLKEDHLLVKTTAAKLGESMNLFITTAAVSRARTPVVKDTSPAA